jgi:DNA polymerase-3 subunit delta'
MAFKDFSEQQLGIASLQRSLERGRLAHGYLFTGHSLEELEVLARTLAKTLNCQRPVQRGAASVDCCDRCPACQKIEHGNHADVHWVRPESKTRIIRIEQIRDLIQEINLKPTEAEYKVAVIVAADRLKTEAANAFLKTLEEPPANSIFVLLTTEPQRLLDTIRSRCLRLNLAGEAVRPSAPAQKEWLTGFTDLASSEQKSLLGRYRLMDVLLGKLTALKTSIEESLTARSPAQRYKDAEPSMLEKWEDELAAAIEAEYRRQRADLLGILHWWLRDVWLQTLRRAVDSARSTVHGPQSTVHSPQSKAHGAETGMDELLAYPGLAGTSRVAQRISAAEALENLQTIEQLQRWLGTNVQEALALEVGLLKLRL